MKQIYQFLLISLFSLPTFLFAQNYTLSGKITQHNGDPIPNLEVSYFGTVMTGVDGKFEFAEIPSDKSYKFSVGEIPGILDDISILDAIEIRRAILAKDLFDTNQQHAGNLSDLPFNSILLDPDFNTSHTLNGISTFDLVLMAKLALGIDIDINFPIDYKLITTIKEPLTKYLLAPNVSLDINSSANLELNVTALKPGDVAVSQDYMFPPNNAPSPTLTISLEDFKAGDEVQFSVTAKDFTNIIGFQHAFNWDTNLLNFENISILNQNGNDSKLNLVTKEYLSEGLIALLFFNPNVSPILLDDDVVLKINFKALADAPTNEAALFFNEQLIPRQIVWQNPNDNELYLLDGEYNNPQRTTSTNELPEGLEKLELFPNPTSSELNVKALFQNATNFEIAIINVLGQQVFTKKFNEKNINFSIDLKEIPNGTYFMKLKTAGGIQTKTFLKK